MLLQRVSESDLFFQQLCLGWSHNKSTAQVIHLCNHCSGQRPVLENDSGKTTKNMKQLFSKPVTSQQILEMDSDMAMAMTPTTMYVLPDIREHKAHLSSKCAGKMLVMFQPILTIVWVPQWVQVLAG